MKKPHIIIYITGLGDRDVSLQKMAIKWWQIFYVKTQLFHVNWTNTEPFSQKLDRLLAVIDEYNEQRYKISLVGTSAGASVAIAAFSRRKNVVSGVVCICGKLRNPQTVRPRYYKQNPAFRDVMNGLENDLAKLTKNDKEKILSIRPLYDQTVLVADTKINGAHRAIIPSFYHVPSIALALTLFSPITIFFLKRKSIVNV